MAHWRQWLLFLCALILSGAPLFAASTKEQRAYAAAVWEFQDKMWSLAETNFAEFLQNYPKSTNAPEAVLLQAQAELHQGDRARAIELLSNTNRLARAGDLADQYAYWLGEAQFQSVDLTNAANTFLFLARHFTASPLRLQAVVEAAAARAELGDWKGVVSVLDETNGVFQREEQLDPTNDLVVRGRLLLAQSKSELNDLPGSDAILVAVHSQALMPDLGWDCAYQSYTNKLKEGDTNAALAETTNLLRNARLGQDRKLLAEGVALHAGLLVQMGRTNEALDAYRENLTNAPVEEQPDAILEIANLAGKLNQLSEAENELQDFVAQFSNSPAADTALLSLGELEMLDSVLSSNTLAATDLLAKAATNLNQFPSRFASSPLLGKAWLDQGWALWLAGQTNKSLAAFEKAAGVLGSSEDLAVAQLKTGDAQFFLGDLTNALENYQAALATIAENPAAQELGECTWYQYLRVCLELKDEAGASNALAQIVKQYPASDLAPRMTLLYGEGLTKPEEARKVFEDFLAQRPLSPLRPQVMLAVARTFEQETNWTAAIGRYETWLADFPTNDLRLRSQADYSLAWANYQAGNETNAFLLFTNFVAVFTNSSLAQLAQLAQMWVGDHFYRAGDYTDAEKNYEFVFQNFPLSPLSYQAKMMAGQAAMAREDEQGASGYFNDLEVDTNCPMPLRVQATLKDGDALMHMDSSDPNNPLANFLLATNKFGPICQLYPTTEQGARASLFIGDCNLQLTNYGAAIKAYGQVLNTNVQASVALRSQAQIGVGIVLEKMAAVAVAGSQKHLREQALGNYLDVFYERNLRDGEQPDEFWMKKAGLQALALIRTLQESPPADFLKRLEERFPQLTASLEQQAAAWSVKK
ncbi:MAG: tetratricopeptide repeat protein [Verrucomicrobiota bacterium]|jgi:TolA-binding protein